MTFDEQGEVRGMAVGYVSDAVMIIPFQWSNDKERLQVIMMAAAILQANGAHAYSTITEAWTSISRGVRPSKSSDRREVVVVTAYDDSTSVASVADIIRHEDCTATLGDFDDYDNVGGVLGTMLTMRVPQEVMKHVMTLVQGDAA